MKKTLTVLLGAGSSAASTAVLAGILFVGSDHHEFATPPIFPDQIVKATVTGATFNSQITINTTFPVNGLGDGPGFLYAGDPLSNTLRTVDYNGNLLTSVAGGFPNFCCNEEMQFAGGKLFHAHYPDVIQEINPVTGAVIETFIQADVVGMALVGSTLWITHWGARQVGTWDPATNVFTPVFSTPTNAGALAFDPDNSILWVGLQLGQVVPYDLAGNALNGGFLPFGSISQTIDGLTFQGEGVQIPPTGTAPVPGTVALLGLGLAAFGFARRRLSA